MRRRGDRRKPIILTEVSWPAAIPGVPRNRRLGLETTARGQKVLLTAAYRRLARERRKLGITQAYWFTWASPYDDDNPLSDVSFRFSGLTRFAGGAFTRKPILAHLRSGRGSLPGLPQERRRPPLPGLSRGPRAGPVRNLVVRSLPGAAGQGQTVGIG